MPPAQEEPVVERTVTACSRNVVAGDDQASRLVLLQAPVVRAPAQGGVSYSALEGREGVSFPELYMSVMAQLDQQQDFLVKMN